MKKYSNLDWIVLALCLLSFVRGAYELGEQSLWWDESLSHYRATKSFPFILSNQIFIESGLYDIRTLDNHPPLYFILLRIAILAAGDSEFAMRFLSLAAGVLVVPLLYQCGKRLCDPLCGMLAALLGSLSPLYLWAQQEARPYALVTLLATATFYALLHVLQKPDPVSPRDPFSRTKDPAIGWRALYALSLAATLATHFLGLLLLPAQGIILLTALSHRKRRLLWILAIAAVISGSVFLWGLQMVPPQTEMPGYRFIPLGTLLRDVFRAFPLGISGTALVFFQWVGVGLLLAVLLVLFARRRHALWQHTIYLSLSFLLPIGGIYALSFLRPAYMNIRHLIFASPFYYLLLAAGISQARNVWLQVPLGLGASTLMIGMLLSTYVYFDSPLYDKEDHRGWGRYLSEHIRPGDFVIVNPGPASELYLYYVKSQAPWVGLPYIHEGDRATIRHLGEIAARYDRVWLAQSMTAYWANPGDTTLKWLEENAVRIAYANFYSSNTVVRAHAFRLRSPPLDALPDDALPLALNYDDRLHLLGLSSPMDRVAAGHTLQLSLYWSAAQLLDREYRVTLSLTDDAGFSWKSLDYSPSVDTYPNSQWPVGRIVRDDIDVNVPFGLPPGRYRLNVSVYPADHSSPALAVRDLASGNLQGLIVPIGKVEVVRPEQPPLDEELSMARRTPHRYGDLSLLGHNYTGGTYQPGDVVLLSAYWRAGRSPRQDLTFSLQLSDEDGRVRSARTIAPAGDYLPGQWGKGEVVMGKYRFRIPVDVPAGRYSLVLAPGGERPQRSLWPWDDGRVVLGTLDVSPSTGGRSFEVPPMQYALRANLGDQVELLGYDLASETVRPGQVVSCTLYWRALQVVNQNYTVFNHLVASDGQTWGQWDNQPQRGRMPTTRWVPGQVVADPYQIPVSADAPPGPLELRVGMYDLLTMARVPAHDESGAVVGDHVVVTEIEVIDR